LWSVDSKLKSSLQGHDFFGSYTPQGGKRLAGVEELIINDHYLVVLGISLFFTVFALVRRTAVLDVIATICWWVSGAVHLVSSPSTSPLFSISYLWFALGIVFFILLWIDVWKLWDFKKSKGDWWMEEV